MEKLALFGGRPVRTKPFPSWPRISKDIKENLFNTLENDGWGVGSDAVKNFEEKYAKGNTNRTKRELEKQNRKNKGR